MLTIKKLSEVSLKDAVDLWNLSFEGYFTDATTTIRQFIDRMAADELSPELSLAAWMDGEPAGIVLNGIRTVNGKTTAWNGGTGIAAKFRGRGIGKQLMNHTIRLYLQHGVNLASLEALSNNNHAIKLYERAGYTVKDQLLFLQKDGQLSDHAFQADKEFHIEKSPAAHARHLKILDQQVPWQTQWASLRKDGELASIRNDQETLAYFLYKRSFNEGGETSRIMLFQSGINEESKVTEAALRFGLREIFEPSVSCTRMTFNFPKSNHLVVRLLEEEGFQSLTEQVYMEKVME